MSYITSPYARLTLWLGGRTIACTFHHFLERFTHTGSHGAIECAGSKQKTVKHGQLVARFLTLDHICNPPQGSFLGDAHSFHTTPPGRATLTLASNSFPPLNWSIHHPSCRKLGGTTEVKASTTSTWNCLGRYVIC